MADISKERKFLHDIATPITVMKGSVNRVLKSFRENKTDAEKELCIDRLERAMKAIENLENLHADHKALISE